MRYLALAILIFSGCATKQITDPCERDKSVCLLKCKTILDDTDAKLCKAKCYTIFAGCKAKEGVIKGYEKTKELIESN